MVDPVGEPHRLEHFAGDLDRMIAAGDVRAELHVLEGREGGKEVECLEDEAHGAAPEGEASRPGGRGDVRPRDAHAPNGRDVQGPDEIQEGGLAAA